ncbi:MAG: hypothetical protein A2140_10270 [Candidatus Muproteobacteria bacterium RBG_16_62_13]|uniref:Uncharacterized protein n=1 Tax=Candidatus Muproteobacteria bacterium RBG_16_62_13 TaxID=1817756 RepID=A0A1F6T0I1_9PROT|nr:MAG: hypothetical protein A2140_10270 [Candidatus Muproteobacteria bacterium RBG_16_62_13]
MTFLELVQTLEQHLGSHQLPLRPHARGLADLIDDGALHPDLMRRLLRDLYVANRCRRLADPVSQTITLDVLGSIRFEILESPSSDIDLCRTIEEFCTAVTTLFAEHGKLIEPADQSKPKGGNGGARIIPLDAARLRRGRV